MINGGVVLWQGVWKPRKIANPEHFVDKTPLKNLGAIGGVAIEIWTMDEGYYFSNIFVGTDKEQAAKYRQSHWAAKKEIEVRRPSHGQMFGMDQYFLANSGKFALPGLRKMYCSTMVCRLQTA